MKRPRWLLVPLLLLAMFMLTACNFLSCNTPPAPKPANQSCADGFEESIRDDTVNGAKNLVTDQEQQRSFDRAATDPTKPETADVDYVKVNLEHGQTYSIRTYDLGANVATRMTLSIGGSVVAVNEIDEVEVTPAKNSRIVYTPKSDGKNDGMYIVKVENLYGKGGCGPDYQYKLIMTSLPVPTQTPTVTATPKATATPTITPKAAATPTSGATPTGGPTGTTSKVKITDWTSVTVNGKEVAVLYPPAEVIIAEITGVKYIKGTPGQWWTQTSRIQGNSLTATDPSGEPCSVVAMNPEKDPGQVLHVLANLKKASVLEGAMASGIKNPNQIRNGQTIVFPHCGEANLGDTALLQGSDFYTMWEGTITGNAPVNVVETKGNFSRVEPVGWVLGVTKPAIKLEKVPTPLSPLKPTPTSGKPKP